MDFSADKLTFRQNRSSPLALVHQSLPCGGTQSGSLTADESPHLVWVGDSVPRKLHFFPSSPATDTASQLITTHQFSSQSLSRDGTSATQFQFGVSSQLFSWTRPHCCFIYRTGSIVLLYTLSVLHGLIRILYQTGKQHKGNPGIASNFSVRVTEYCRESGNGLRLSNQIMRFPRGSTVTVMTTSTI